jgi:hypothetical protein
MAGRREDEAGGEQRLLVEATLEGVIAHVERAVAAYLANATDSTRQSLIAALEQLDAQAEQSDAYESSVIGSAALGFASKGEVLGETSIDSVVDEVPSTELNGQFALVKAAKEEVRGHSSGNFAALNSASAALAATRHKQA